MDEKIFYIAISVTLMVLLVLFPGVAHLGTTNGMRLFFDNLFPYLLPYFILTHWILLLSRPIANSTFSVLIRTYILSAFGGFPTGAVILNQMVLNDEISKKQAAYLLPICHNPSPIFVIGFVSNTILHDTSFGWRYLAIIHIVSVVFLFFFIVRLNNSKRSIPTKTDNTSPFSSSIQNSIPPILIVGSTIIFFSTIYEVCKHLLERFYPYPSEIISTLFAAVLELTNGIVQLNSLFDPSFSKILLVLLLTSQSFSIHFQVFGVMKDSSISYKPYFFIRAFYCVIVPLLFILSEKLF